MYTKTLMMSEWHRVLWVMSWYCFKVLLAQLLDNQKFKRKETTQIL